MSQETGDLQARLRVLMDIAAGEPSRTVSLDAVRQAVVKRRRTASFAAVAALVLAVGAGTAIAAQRAQVEHLQAGHPTGNHSLVIPAPGTSGVPRYYIVRSAIPNNGSAANLEETTVRATGSGAVLAHVACPSSAPYVTSWPVAPAANQSFFLVCQLATGPQSYAKVIGSRILQFHVTSSGLVTAARPVRGGVLGPVLVRSVAATPDGSEIAAIVYPGNHPPDLHATAPDVIVIDTRTGAHAIWRGAPPLPGKTVYWPQEISLTADGQKLVFLTEPQCFQTGCTTRGGQQMRVVTHPASGGGELNSAKVLPGLYVVAGRSAATVMGAVISPDGSTLTLAVMGTLSGKPDPESMSVIQIPASGPRRLRFVYRLPQGDSFIFFSADPTGRHFLLGTGTPDGPVSGRIDNGRLIPLSPDPTSVQDIVW